MKNRFRLSLILLVGIVFLSAGVAPVQAHALLVRSIPAANASLAHSPAQPVTLWLLVLADILYILAFVVLDKPTRLSMGLDTVPFVAIMFADLSIHAVQGLHTDGQLYYWISQGVANTAMPAFGQKMSDRDIWNLVNFVRTLATH